MNNSTETSLKNEASIEYRKKDCLLLHVPKITKYNRNLGWTSFNNFIAMGLFSLCNQLEKNGFNTEIVNIGIEKHLDKNFSIADYIKDLNIKFVGLSLHWHFQTYDTIEVARAIKLKNPNVFIFLGGYTASCYAEEILTNFPFIDAVIKGEGEIPIVELARKVINNKGSYESIPNLCWRKHRRVKLNSEIFVATSDDLDTFSFYSELERLKNYSFYLQTDVVSGFEKNNNKKFIVDRKEIHTICLGRGCTGNCGWCGGGADALKKITNRNHISWRSPEKVAEEIFMLQDKYNVNNFYFCFDPTPSDQKHIIKLFELLGKAKEKVFVFFECFGLPTENFLSAFKKNLSEDSVVVLSPEFANEKLRLLHRSFYFTNEELESTLESMEKQEIKSVLFFTSIPTSSIDDNKETSDYIKYLRGKYSFICSIFNFPINRFEPAAPWTENPEKYGLKNYLPREKTFKDFYLEHSSLRISWESLCIT